MLEQIFGSAARTKLIKFFCLNQEGKFFVRELGRQLRIQLNSVRRELANLEKFGFLLSENKQGKKYYTINPNFTLLKELRYLVFKAITLEEMRIAERMSRISGLSLLIFTGHLTSAPTGTDVLIVGKVNKNDFYGYLEKIAEGMNEPLRYTFLSKADYIYRVEITDKFIYNILSNDHIVVVDKLSKELKRSQFEDFNFKHFKQE